MSKTFKNSKGRHAIEVTLRRAANTKLAVDGSLAYEIADSLIEALGMEPYFDHTSRLGCVVNFSGDADFIRNMYLREELLSKYDSHELGINTEAAAWKKFHDAELVCKLTNDRLYRPMYNEDFNFSLGERCLHTARRKIHKLLGDAPSWDTISSHCRFSGGASTTNSRKRAHGSFKLTSSQECTPRARKYVEALYENSIFSDGTLPSYHLSPFNKAVTVPKNSKTDRCIAIEPGWNMFFQLGVGGVIRDRLRCWGIDLNDQTHNQRAAKDGSIDGSLATVDLSAASDTISIALVELLLPPGWFEILSDLRSPYGKLPDGSVIKYEKFSSMGNGFTFELESLIFSALARSLCELLDFDMSHVLVYGDDIIIASELVRPLIEVFSYVGFTTNAKKTFFEGGFRESCGKHYYYGHDITPFYIRRSIRTPADLILVLNSIYRWGTIDGVWDPRVLPVYNRYKRLLPRILQRNVIPDGIGDGALVGSAIHNPFHVNRGGSVSFAVICDHNRRVSRSETGSYIYSLIRTFSQGYPASSLSDVGEYNIFDNNLRLREAPLPVEILEKTGRFDVVYVVCSDRLVAPFGGLPCRRPKYA